MDVAVRAVDDKFLLFIALLFHQLTVQYFRFFFFHMNPVGACDVFVERIRGESHSNNSIHTNRSEAEHVLNRAQANALEGRNFGTSRETILLLC